MSEASVKRDWLRILSPAVIASAFSLLVIIGSLLLFKSHDGWSILGLVVFGPVFLALAFLDFLIKIFIKEKTWLIWLLELIAIGLIYLIWKYKIS